MTVHSPEQMQAAYYTDHAGDYDRLYGRAGEHALALDHVLALVQQLGLSSVLDVGSGTGRAVKHFLAAGLDVTGVEPVQALIEQAEAKHAVPSGTIRCGRGESLPFEDSSFDVVGECGVLHHVAKPNDIVREMTRVARRVVFLSDENRFGMGWPLSSICHLAMHWSGIGRIYNWLRTGGKGYVIDRDDGLRYSYSVYESYHLLSEWADYIYMVPTKTHPSASRHSWIHPLLTASHVVVCAVRHN